MTTKTKGKVIIVYNENEFDIWGCVTDINTVIGVDYYNNILNARGYWAISDYEGNHYNFVNYYKESDSEKMDRFKRTFPFPDWEIEIIKKDIWISFPREYEEFKEKFLVHFVQ